MTAPHLDEHQTRLHKRTQLIEAQIPPYANKFNKTHDTKTLATAAQTYNLPPTEMLMENGAENSYSVAGRVMMFRSHGKLSFATIQDDLGTIQLSFVKDMCSLNTGKDIRQAITIEGQEISAYKFVEKYIDVADFIWAKGELFVTKHGELTLFVNEFQLLSKALRPLGDKWHGIQDEEMIYRQRYLDMTMNKPSFERMLLRSKFIKTLREFYRSHSFVELDTPILWNSASGAAATPFSTHHEDFDIDMYLRIAPEIALKIATAGWLEKVFEIGKDFRNEWSSPSHQQEFSVVEHYAAYRNFQDNMKFTEEMFDYLFTQLPELSRVVRVADKEGSERQVDFTTPRQRIDYIAQIKKDADIDVALFGPEDDQKLRELIQAKWFTRQGIETQTTATMIDYLYKKVTRPKIIWPAFIYNYPKTMQPLARQSDENPQIVEQFQVIVNGREILKAYSELVDPVIQAENFNEQADAAQAGDSEVTRSDDEFLTAMEHGMPPQSGRGMGIDRILAMLTEQSNIRDVIMFPMLKPVHIQEVVPQTNTSNEKTPKESTPNNLPQAEQALQLVEKYLHDTKRHCLQVGEIMRACGKEIGEDEHYRWLAGVLHDIDRDHIAKDGSKHLKAEFEQIMDSIDAPQLLRDDIKSHGEWLTWVPVDSLIRKYLASVDELSGFLFAYSLMRPTWFEGMEAKGAMKRIKDKTFAAGVDREHVRNCEKYLDIPLDQFTAKMITIMQQI